MKEFSGALSGRGELPPSKGLGPLANAEKVSRVKDPMVWTEEKVRLMVEACRELAVFHHERSPEIRRIYKKYGFDPESIRSEADLQRIPVVGVHAMKYHLLLSLPPERSVLTLTSSGTRGQKTQVWFDAESLDRVQGMLTGLWEEVGLVSDKPTNYAMFVYDPAEAKDLGIAFSDKNQQRFAPVAESYYAIRKDASGGWEFRKKAALEKLRAFAKDGKPVRIFGIPSFIYEFLAELGPGERLRLPEGSWVVVGGGWKAAEDKKVSREYFREKITELLGVPSGNIRDGYGLAEHSAPYIDCAEHRFHVPVYNRVIPRDPSTMKVLPPGETGLLELITPYNAMMPNLALLTTDMGYIDKEPCPCGLKSPTFTLVGRGGISKHKGCAIHAADIVKR